MPSPPRNGGKAGQDAVPTGFLPVARASPNIWYHTEIYEIENRAADPEGRLDAALRSVCDWAGREVVDLGCGAGFHLGGYAETARHVYGVEPHQPLAALAARRSRRFDNVTVCQGSAEATGLSDNSADVLIARWVWATETDQAVAEMGRILRPGGVAMIVDNDPGRSRFGRWFAQARPDRAASSFWADGGWRGVSVEMGWRFDSRADFEAVMGIEFDPSYAEQFVAEHDGAEVDYAVNLWHHTF